MSAAAVENEVNHVTQPSAAGGPAGPGVSSRRRLVDSIKNCAFVIGTAAVCFAAARNSITWHLQQFWGASGNFWQNRWEAVYDLFGGSDVLLIGVGTWLVSTGVFWTFNVLLLLLDVFNKPAFLIKYRIQDDAPVDGEKLRRGVLRVIFNQTVIGLPLMAPLYYLYKARGISCGKDDLPTFQYALFELFVCILVEEVGFYYSHRLMHHPRIYKHIHKIHHEWTAPVGIIALYAHPLEHVLSNLTPPMLGPLLTGCHIATAWLWFALALVSTTISHSGYHFPLLPSPEAHDYHHLKFVNNFGVLGVLDRLHGTDQMFRESRQYQRHVLLLGITPLTQQIPDDTKAKAQ